MHCIVLYCIQFREHATLHNVTCRQGRRGGEEDRTQGSVESRCTHRCASKTTGAQRSRIDEWSASLRRASENSCLQLMNGMEWNGLDWITGKWDGTG